ncbi:MAG TPA: serine/threonine-protein kinase [Polyangia bacterium]|nr:serine/threonine-protein kinase [Polyangia bacterium]
MGQQIGNYKVIQKLGEGGMGVVYLAEHAVIGRQAAIKLLLPAMSANAEAVTRFFNEARATARIKHPGIVEILDCGTLPNAQAYIVMEFLPGETLGSYAERHGKLSSDVNLARAIVRQVAMALAAAHARGIIHRDLKPDNVFLCSEGGAVDVATVKILDFGIAKLVSAGQMPAVTTTSELLGTPVYISPEQCKGAKDLDHRTDIYSLGCIAFELLTGQPVFHASSLAELIASHMFKPPPPLRELEPTVPAAFADLILRMLAKSPEERPRTMDEIVADIDATGVPPALRGSSVLLSSARPLKLALPTEEPAPPGGIVTLGAGGRPARAAVPTEPPAGSTFSGLVSEARPDGLPAGRRKRAWAIAGGVAAVAGVAALLLGRMPERAHEGGARPAATAATAAAASPLAPTTVDIDVDDRPAGLTVTVDGRPGRVPISLPRGPGTHTLVFQADGYAPMTRTLDATKSRTLVLGMQRRPPAPAPVAVPASKPPAAVKRPGKSPPRKPGKRATDLFLDI